MTTLPDITVPVQPDERTIASVVEVPSTVSLFKEMRLSFTVESTHGASSWIPLQPTPAPKPTLLAMIVLSHTLTPVNALDPEIAVPSPT